MASINGEILAAEDRFFAALSKGDRAGLDAVLGDDCILIDVLTGSEVPRSALLDLVASRRLVFGSIERIDARVRHHDNAGIVTGQTRMMGHFDAQPFRVDSRYTHVYLRGRGGWRLVNAQGTPIVPAAV